VLGSGVGPVCLGCSSAQELTAKHQEGSGLLRMSLRSPF
jgi:hypothetical protein